MFGLWPISKKEKNKQVIFENQTKGRSAEDIIRMKYTLMGYDVRRTGKGSDFIAIKRDLVTGKTIDKIYLEVKSGNARLSKTQKKTKRKKNNYKVERVDPPFYGYFF